MRKVIIEPHYLGCLEFFIIVVQSDEVIFEVSQHFTKQTYKNRCYVLSSGGPVPLSVPVSFDNRTAYKDVTIDYRQSWVRDHWGAFYSSYGKAPFFEYFQDHFQEIWNRQPKYLLDLNMEMMTMCLKVLQYDRDISLTQSYELEVGNDIIDLREQIHPKISFEHRKIYLPFSYTQTFGNIFVPNLSIIDLIMCEGSRASELLTRSAY